MLRTDDILYSGATSATAETKLTPRDIQREQTESQRQKLKPAAELVLAEIAKERESVLDLRTFIMSPEDTEESVLVEMKARKQYLAYLNSLKTKIETIVADKPKRGKANG